MTTMTDIKRNEVEGVEKMRGAILNDISGFGVAMRSRRGESINSPFVQNLIPLAYNPQFNKYDFFVSDSNKAAYDVVTVINCNLWPSQRAIICGEHGSGKSHLAAIFCSSNPNALCINEQGFSLKPLFLQNSEYTKIDNHVILSECIENFDYIARSLYPQSIILEDIELIDDQRLIVALMNLCSEYRIPLLLTSSRKIDYYKNFPDLHSRLLASSIEEIDPPDNALARAILRKQIYDLHLSIGEPLISCIESKIESRILSDIAHAFSYADISRIIEMINDMSAINGKKITIKMINELFDQSSPLN